MFPKKIVPHRAFYYASYGSNFSGYEFMPTTISQLKRETHFSHP